MTKSKKVYGVVEEMKVGGDNKHYIKIKDLNTDGVYHFATSNSSENNYGGEVVDVGTRLAFFPKHISKNIVTPNGKVTIYQNKQQSNSSGSYQDDKNKRLAAGNMVTVAKELLDNPTMEEVFTKAKELFEPCNEYRSRMTEQYPDRDQYDLGAKVGQSLIMATKYCDGSAKSLIENAEKWLKMHIEYEESL